MRSRRLDEATKRKLAVFAGCDPRSIERAFRGAPVRGLAGHRARATLNAAGFLRGFADDTDNNPLKEKQGADDVERNCHNDEPHTQATPRRGGR